MPDWSPAVVEMRAVALRAMLLFAFANATALGTLATVTAASGDRVRVALAFVIAALLAVMPIRLGATFARAVGDAPWLLPAGAALGAVGLMIGAPARSTLFAAFLTPVGICLLAEKWATALQCALILTVGYAASVPLGSGASLGGVLGDVLPAGAVIIGGWVPAQLAYWTIGRRTARVQELRVAEQTRTPGRRRVGRPGMSHEYDSEIVRLMAEELLTNNEIAERLVLSKAQVRERVRRLIKEAGVANRFELARWWAARAELEEPA